MALQVMANKYTDSPSFDQVADSIMKLYGDLSMHMRNLESVEKSIDQKLRITDRPSVAFELNDLRSLLNGVLIRVNSYKRCCQDLAEFGDDYDKERLKTVDGMLPFLKILSNFSFQLNKRVDDIIAEIPTPEIFSHPTDEEEPYCNCIAILLSTFSLSLTVTTCVKPSHTAACEERLENLREKTCQLKLTIQMLSKNIERILSTWSGREHSELCKGIDKIKASCTHLRHQLVNE